MSVIEPGSPEWRSHVDHMILMESTGEYRWWWLSFCDPTRPEGEQFLGVAIVNAPGPVTAIQVAHALGINPGGEVAQAAIPPESVPEPIYRGRLLDLDEAKAVGSDV